MSFTYLRAIERWNAMVCRDAQADGAFFYAVKTTGIFCRPTCASRLPRRENVVFFATANEARAAGYRDCKRCQPSGEPRDIAIVKRACATLDASPHIRITLAELSRAVHLSPFHLQRLFKRLVGVSPRQYQAAHRAAALRDALQNGETVTRAAAHAGFQSPSRLYSVSTRELGMAPSTYRNKGKGLRVRYTTATTSLGEVMVAATDKGICRIVLGDHEKALIDELRNTFSNAELIKDSASLAPFIAQINAYLTGKRHLFDLPLDISATAFQQRVWAALQRIPYGQTRSYTQIAAALGAPNAVRAVANACAANPVALAIPCHRVIQKSGALAGYRWGLARKAALLEAEAQHANPATAAKRAAKKEEDAT